MLFGPYALYSFIGSAFGVGGVDVLMVVDTWDGTGVVGVIYCHGSHLAMVPLFFSFFQVHVTTWSVHGHSVYKHPGITDCIARYDNRHSQCISQQSQLSVVLIQAGCS